MLAGYLRFSGAAGYGQVEIQDFSSGQAAAFDVVPSAQHFRGDAEILGYRLDRIALADFVARGGARVGAGITLLAGGDWNDKAGFGRQRVVIQVVRFGYGFRSGVVGAGDRGQGFSGLHLVITPPDALVGGN